MDCRRERDGNPKLSVSPTNTAHLTEGSVMTMLEACVSQFSLTVDATDTIQALVDSSDHPWGRRLHDALKFATYAECVYAVEPHARVELVDFRPDAPKYPDVADRSVSGVLGELQAAGYVDTCDVLQEDAGQTYLSEGRTVTAVHVVRPFALVGVDYRFSREANSRAIRYGHAYADRWEITERAYTVPAGWYLVGETGDFTAALVGVAGIMGDSDDLLCSLFEIEGFGASTCLAGCGSCGTRWSAESGTCHFRPDDCDADAWDFDDAADVDDESGTVACPACATGRVGFSIS